MNALVGGFLSAFHFANANRRIGSFFLGLLSARQPPDWPRSEAALQPDGQIERT
jgi:hypothetical protein